MELFETTIECIRRFVQDHDEKRSWTAHQGPAWPEGGNRNIVLKEDMGLELGSPETESLSCILWTEKHELLNDSAITLVGPDIAESYGKSLPFAKIVLVAVDGFTEENTYERYQDMEFLRYQLDLKGFMLRAVSQYMREWCRISREAIIKGFSAQVLGSALMALFHEKSYVKAFEVIFFTSSTDDVKKIKEIIEPSQKIIAAMNKMAEEFDFDCASCEYQDVCNEADVLKGMRNNLINNTRGVEHG
jgi:CO dehydrogenase/acetyl-CoA synthase beta subunit